MRKTFPTFTFRSTSLGIKQKVYGNHEQNTKSEASHPKTMTFQLAEQVWSAECTISAHEREHYFLRMLLLHKSWTNSFGSMRLHEGFTHQTYRDTCCAMGLLSDDAEWLRCMEDAFPSDFD